MLKTHRNINVVARNPKSEFAGSKLAGLKYGEFCRDSTKNPPIQGPRQYPEDCANIQAPK